MKDLKYIEKMLQDARLPDVNTDEMRLKMWKSLLENRRSRHKRGLLYKIKPWMWALASIVFILLCIILMIAIAKGAA